MEDIHMAHAGTIDLGTQRNAKTGSGGSRWQAVGLILVGAVAAIGIVWFASSAGLVGGTAAKPAADRSYDAIEAQRGAVTLSSDRSRALDAYLTGILDRAHATPYAGEAVTLSGDEYLNGILDRAHATPYAVTMSYDAYLNGILDGAHATPYAGEAAQLPFIATSGTFHPSKDAAQQLAQGTRDRVGGP